MPVGSNALERSDSVAPRFESLDNGTASECAYIAHELERVSRARKTLGERSLMGGKAKYRRHSKRSPAPPPCAGPAGWRMAPEGDHGLLPIPRCARELDEP